MDLMATITAIYYFLKISLQFISIVVRAKYSFWKAKRAFRRALISEGLPRESAIEIAAAYPNPMAGLLGLMRSGMSVPVSGRVRLESIG